MSTLKPGSMTHSLDHHGDARLKKRMLLRYYNEAYGPQHDCIFSAIRASISPAGEVHSGLV